MSKQKLMGANLESWIGLLASNDGMIRQRARKSLVALGKPAVSPLVQSLRNSKLDQVRWEAAKALGEICDAGSIITLVTALEDGNHDVAWVAANALRKLKKTAWLPVLRALLKRGTDSVLLRQGAHHVFRNQKEKGFNDLLAGLMKALKPSAAPEAASVVAYEMLGRLEMNS